MIGRASRWNCLFRKPPLLGWMVAKIGQKTLEGADREVATTGNPVKKFAIIDHKRRQPRLGNPGQPAIALGIGKKLIAKAHGG